MVLFEPRTIFTAQFVKKTPLKDLEFNMTERSGDIDEP